MVNIPKFNHFRFEGGSFLCVLFTYVTMLRVNPSNAEATFVQSTRMQRFLKTILTLSCWYSLDSSHLVLSDEYPYTRVSVIFVLAKLATSSFQAVQLKDPFELFVK